MKTLLFGSLLIVLAAAASYPKTACGSGASHSLLLGNRTYGDKLLYTSPEKIESSLLRVKTKDVHYPLAGQQVHETITRLEAIDTHIDGTGGCAFLVGGGVGSHFASLHIKTQRGGEADFRINIYGK